jgi:hypothetical protein
MGLHTVAWFVYKVYPYIFMNWQNKTDVFEMYNRFPHLSSFWDLRGGVGSISEREVRL